MGPRCPAFALILVALTMLGAGCGSSGDETHPEGTAGESPGAATESAPSPSSEAPPGVRARKCGPKIRATGVDCATAEAVAGEWEGEQSCQPKAGASRFSCSLGPYRCIGTVTGRGRAVFCARAGRSIVFATKP
jgi:hypothetical protein